jgi:dTMP kinase
MFITFEGIDCSGKSTQIDHLIRKLRRGHWDVLVVREPGGTEISERIRTLLLDVRHGEMDGSTELLLFSASRSQLVTERIQPALERGDIVIADRFHDSTTAYQGFGRGIDVEAITHIHRIATHGLSPDISFFLDISVEESLKRRSARAGSIDRMEAADTAFFERVREGYLSIASISPSRFRIIDGMRPAEPIAEEIWGWVASALPPRSGKEK